MSWRIAPTPAAEGEAPDTVERSVDAGRTWQPFAIDVNVRFRAVFAVGREVWAGGTGGALYHSADSGDHWERVSLPFERDVPAGDVVGIQFTDFEHGFVVISDGGKWRTADGGRHWRRSR